MKNEKIEKFDSIFFSLPALLAIMAVLTGVFSGTIGPFGRDNSSYVFFLALYNVYTYLFLWGYWPVSINIDVASNPEEETRLNAQFTTATEFSKA